MSVKSEEVEREEEEEKQEEKQEEVEEEEEEKQEEVEEEEEDKFACGDSICVVGGDKEKTSKTDFEVNLKPPDVTGPE